jgi:branched-chain amino acid aminotransferase
MPIFRYCNKDKLLEEVNVSACWLDGKLVNEEQAKISVFDHGLLYGDGVFEGIRFYNYQPFRLEKHLQRLFYSARAINLNIPYSKTELGEAITEVIQAFAKADGYLRLVITRGKGSLGINPASCKKATAFIIADQLTAVSDEVKQNGAKLIIASTRRLAADGLDPRIKSLNYLNHILARMEATHAGADEAILLNAQGNVTEGSTDNIFIVKENKILTPTVTDGALDGITREVVFEIAHEQGISCYEKTLSPYDLYTADECFLTGTAMELVAVAEIDGRNLPECPGAMFSKLQNLFKEKITAGESIMPIS